MKDGNYYGDSLHLVIEKYTTKSGLLITLLSTPIWAFIVLDYSKIWYSSIEEFIGDIISYNFPKVYVSYLLFGILLSIIGILINYTIFRIIEVIR